MKNVKIQKICAVFLTFIIVAGILPATIINASAQGFESKYPERIIEEIISDDLEAYEPDTAVIKLYSLGYTWFPNGNNQNAYAIITETDNGNIIRVPFTSGGWPTYTTPAMMKAQGVIWIDQDVKIVNSTSDFRMQFGGSYTDLMQLSFRNGNLYALTQNAAGSSSDMVIEGAMISGEWFTLSVRIDTVNKLQRIYINGEQVGHEMHLNHKFDYIKTGNEPSEDYVNKVSYCLKDEGGVAELDNLRIAYGREILPIDDMSLTIDVGENYTLPANLDVEMDNGSFMSFPVTWTLKSDSELDTNTVGAYFYEGSIPYYDSVISLVIYVKERTISEIPTIYDTAFKNSVTYTLPQTVPATMSDGGEKSVPVIWRDTADVSELGTFEYYGDVDGFGEVKLILSVVAPSVKKVNDLYEGVALGEEYDLPTRVEVTFDDFSRGWAEVTWDNDASVVDTQSLGKYYFTGSVDGYSKNINLTVTVYEDDPDLEYFLDCVTEFYDNCLTVGRDRTMWFPEEDHSPLFSAAIDRETGTHALWPGVSGNYPVEASATYGPLIKGLVGLTNIKRQHTYEGAEDLTPEEQEAEVEKYLEAVEEQYAYILNNFVAEESGILAWGDHISRRFDTKNFEGFDSTVNALPNTHQLEDDYPEWDIMFRMNPEVTERYIKALWGAHFGTWSDFAGQLDKMYFNRHTTVTNKYDAEEVDAVFEHRPDEDPTVWVHSKYSQLPYIIAATDFALAAVELYQNKGDEGALYWGKKLVEMYHAAANPDTGIVPFQFTSTNGGDKFIGDVWYGDYDAYLPVGRMEHAFPDYVDNPWCVDSGSTLQGSFGGGSLSMPLMCFALADELGEEGEELEEWGISALEAFVNHIYNFRTGFGDRGLTDGTSLVDVKIKYQTYYANAGSTVNPGTPNNEMTWVMLDGYERSGNQMFWECLRSMLMYEGLGDIGTAPGENVEIFEYTESKDNDILITLSRLYEITGEKEYYKLAKRIAKNIIKEHFINGWFYMSPTGKFSRISDPQPYAILYFVAAAEGRSGMLPKYLGESQDFQLVYKYNDVKKATIYAVQYYNDLLDGTGGVTSVETSVSEAKLSVGDTLEISAEVAPADADDLTLTWYSDNKKCCIVDKNGVVKALSPGKAVITAEALSGAYADVTIYVE